MDESTKYDDTADSVFQPKLSDATVMAPSMGLRFSGINATMEALLPVMRQSMSIACCGGNLSDQMPRTSLWKWLRSPMRKQWRIWHSRRNNDMLLGLLLRHVLRQKLILLFTSAGQREHTRLTRFCYHRMDAVIATTAKAASFLKCPATISHHGVDTTTFQPPADRTEVRKLLGIDAQPTLGVFGRIRPQKGTGDLVEALLQTLPQFPEWRVILIGAVTAQFQPYKDQLDQKLRDAGLADRVQFRGFLKDFSELPRWYQAVDAVACVSRNEGFGVTCLEGMASGTPVLATRAAHGAKSSRREKMAGSHSPATPATSPAYSACYFQANLRNSNKWGKLRERILKSISKFSTRQTASQRSTTIC